MATAAFEHGAGGLQETETSMMSSMASIFDAPIYETSMVSGKTTIIHPTNTDSAGPFTFEIPKQGTQYLHLAATRVYMLLQLERTDGTPHVHNNDEPVAPVNLIGSSLFKSMDVSVNHVLVPEFGNNYSGYKAYNETLLSYSNCAVESHLNCSRWNQDAYGHYDRLTADPNSPFLARERTCRNSIPFELMMPLNCDFFQSDKLLMPGMHLTLTLNRAPDAFTVLADGNEQWRFKVLNIELHLRYITLKESKLKEHLAQIERMPIRFCLNKSELKPFAQPLGDNTVRIYNMFQNIFPKTIIISMVRSVAFTGHQQFNPYNYQHFGLNYASLQVNSEHIPSKPYTPDWVNARYVRELREFYDNVGISDRNMGNLVTPFQYAGGCFMLAFDLTPDKCNGRHTHEKNSGVISLELRFAAALAHHITVLAYAIYDADITIDKTMHVASAVAP